MHFSVGLVSLFTLLCHPYTVVAQEVTINSIKAGFSQSKLVPDVLPSFDPLGLLEVVYTVPSSNETIRVRPGMNLTVSQTAAPPRLGLSGLPPAASSGSFVAVLVDPDAPTPQNRSLAEFLHVISGDLVLSGSLPGSSTSELVNRTQAAVEYVGPGPPPGSDPHRYAFLVFSRRNAAGSASFSTVAAPFANATTPRTGFDLVKFAEQTGLVGPIAGTFFSVGPEDSGPATAPSSVRSGSPSAPTDARNAAGSMVNIPTLCITITFGLAFLTSIL